MKLELKHIVPYLPYGLKLYDIGTSRIITEVNVQNIEFTSINIRDKDSLIKPILRPLLDLTKEIEVDCELTNISKDNTWGRFEEIATLKPHQLRFIQLREYELLLEYHFDIFGLIENGLAIDINTLNK